MKSRAFLLTMVLLSACSQGSSGGGGFAAPSGSTAGGSTAGGATGGTGGSGSTGTGVLATKAGQFDGLMRSQHTPEGLVFDAILDSNGNYLRSPGGGDSTIWTGTYIASQAYRYEVTGDAAALANMERSLWALHTCHEITGEPGYFCRSWGDPKYYPINGKVAGTGKFKGLYWNSGGTSRDQYTGIFFAYSRAWPHIQDQALRDTIKADIRAICANLMANNLALVTNINGKRKEHFRVAPDNAYQNTITPQNWATVDDFPLNLIVKKVPYDADLAKAISTLQLPPVRGGEAMRALLFFSVAAHITKDPAIESFYRDELITKRRFPEITRDYGNLVDDLLNGNNIPVIKQALLDVSDSFAKVFSTYFAKKWGNGNAILAAVLQPVIDAVFKTIMSEVTKVVTKSIVWLTQPGNFNRLGNNAQSAMQAAQILDILGLKKIAKSIRSVAGNLSPYQNTDLSDAADALRSYVGNNLGFLSRAGFLTVEQDPRLRGIVTDSLEGTWQYISDEQNTLFNYIHSGYGAAPVPSDISSGRESLLRHYADNYSRAIDNSQVPGLRVSPWPDRFGRVGNLSLDVFPLDQREAHNYVWQQHPREIKKGRTDRNHKNSGEGYLLAYWMGRKFGFLSAQD